MRGKFSKLLAIVLTLSLCLTMAIPAYAYSGGFSGGSKGISSLWSKIVSWYSSQKEIDTGDESESESSEAAMTVVEDETTVEDSSALRASTYTLTASNDGTSTTADESDTTLKYFPVTMYDYDYSIINEAMHQAEVEEALASGTTLTQWNGLYFSRGNPTNTTYVSSSYSYTYDLDEEVTAWVPVSLDDIDSSSTYVIVGARGQALTGSTDSITGTATGSSYGANIDKDSTVMDSATAWTITKTSSGYTISATISGSTRYMTIGNNSGTTSTSSATLTITETDYNDNSVSIGQSVTSSSNWQQTTTTYWLNQNGGASGTTYTGYSTADGSSDDGSRFYIYAVQTVSTGTASTGSLGFANWNYYTGNLGSGNYLYSAIASSTLDSSGNIVFNASSAGNMLFDSDSSVKTIYTNVEMPFVYDSDTSTYTFDSDQYGVYFSENETQGSTTAQSNGRLYWSSSAQTLDASVGNDETVWAPYDDAQAVASGQRSGTTEDVMDYHFGMKATIPFTMTTTGRLNDADEDSDAIVFSFSGDDDVWIYIDGTLVVDLGGIKNRLSATVDFANNVVTVTAADNGYASAGAISDANGDTTTNLVANGWTYTSNGTSSTYTHALFNDDDSTGLINMTRETFAASTSHELSVFYLERGEGGSDCKITFNLPVYDYVSVTKQITQAKDDDGNVSVLSESEQAMVDNVDFGFTLYAGEEVVANETYNIVNVDGQVVGSASTDSSGHFTLKNGQTARFTGLQFSSDNTTVYYVVEDSKSGYTEPTYTYSATAANGASQSEAASGLTSMKVSVQGGDEAEDSLSFVCTNYLSANLPNPGVLMSDEEIVIDYGLSVVISPLDNEVYRGESIELISIKAITGVSEVTTGTQTETATLDKTSTIEGTYGTATLNGDGTITYQLTEQLTGVEVIEYEVKVTGTGNTGDQQTVDYAYNTGKVYIIPATVMYYEENFGDITFNSDGTTVASSGIVTFTTGNSSGWTAVGTAETDPQEPGVVGTLTDSTYGSDAAYINDGAQDSNGTSMHVNTSTGAAQFSYTFTGTGTSFFARTTNTSGYMQVKVSSDVEGFDTIVQYRDTYYATEDNSATLYNIPVYTLEGLDYGTYTVTVTIAKESNVMGYGSEFWLDGIRILNPLDSKDSYYSIGTSAYAADGEYNMTTVTLRNKLLSKDSDGNAVWNENSFVVFTDTNGEIKTADTYESIGPKEEVYLSTDQTVTFALENWNSDTNHLYLGIKAPSGNGTVSINGTTLKINSAVDSYYDIASYASISNGTATFVITCTSDSFISLTNIKVTGTASFAIIPSKESDSLGNGE